MTEENNNTVEIIEREVAPAPEEKKQPTREELKSTGWSAKELDAAEKRGMISKPEKKEEPKLEEKKEEAIKTEEPEVKEPPKEERRAEERRSSLPDFTFKTPEQEKAFLDAFGAGTPQRAMYFRMKNERQSRQAAESRIRELEARLQTLETAKPQPKVEVDENGNEIDPDDKPLTARQLREMQQREADEREKKEQEIRSHGERVAASLRDQEEYARSINPDFDDTVKLAGEVMQKLDEFVPDIKSQKRIMKLVQDLQVAAAHADRLGLDDYNAADISYEIGKFHPQYGKKANGHSADINGNSDRPEKANGSLTPEQMKRIEANTQRRASSASIPGGGGKRVVSSDDVTLVELNKMDYSERQAFKKKYPERYTKLLRG